MTAAIDTVTRETSALADAVASLVVQDTLSYQTAGSWLRKVKGHRLRIKEFFAPIMNSARGALDTARSQMTTLDQPAADMELMLKRKMEEYASAQRERAEQERRRAAEEQRQAQADADARASADTARRVAEAQAEADAETARRRQEAELAASLDEELRGEPVTPAEVIPVAPVAVLPTFAAPVFVPPAVVAAPPRADGVSFREHWTFEVVDASLVPREYLAVDEAKVRGVVRALKSTTNIPGIRAYSQRIAAARAS